MREITVDEFTQAISNDLCECFEMFFEQRYYIEALSNLDKFYLRIDDCKKSDFYNASCYFAYNQNLKKYAFQLESDNITCKCYEFETLLEMQNFAFELLKTLKH